MSQPPHRLRIGTRGSDLARWQTNHIADLLRRAHPGLSVEIVVIPTRGDRVLDTPIPLIGGKGVFTAELETALHSGAIDYAVHSLKDLPTDDPAGLVIGAIPARADASDVLVSRAGYTLDSLPESATIGTGSPRRAAQIRHLRPDLRVEGIRGNIDTRVRKALDPDGPYDAIILARAGLARLQMEHVISDALSLAAMLPAPGQGALAVQCRERGDSRAVLAPIQDGETTRAVMAERAFLHALEGGCAVPVAAYATLESSADLLLHGRVCAPDGSQKVDVSRRYTVTSVADAKRAGAMLAAEAIARGADRLLDATS